MPQAATPIGWLDWAGASARARELDRPIFLLLETRWSRSSRTLAGAMEEDHFIPALVQAGFCPVRLDAERRPDLADRYGFGEWPSVAFLTPDGALLGGGAGTSPPRLLDLLRRVEEAWRVRRSEIERAAHASEHAPQEPREPRESQASGEALEPDEIRLLLAERDEPAAREALDRLIADLVDPDDGGIFSQPARARRTTPARPKLLAANADVLDLFTQAGLALADARYLEQAQRLASFVGVWLADPVGGFAASLMAEPTEVDATLYVDANARMISAMVRAGAALEAPALTEVAIPSLERLVLATYRPGDGVGHVCDDPEVRGLLVDQVWLAEALMDAHEATAREPYEMLAAELLHYCTRVLWDAEGGGFFDRAESGHRLKPFALNCRAARVLRRGTDVCGEPMFAERGRATLEALAAARARGADAAAFALALLAAGLPPLDARNP